MVRGGRSRTPPRTSLCLRCDRPLPSGARSLACRGSLELVCHRCFLVGSISGLLEGHELSAVQLAVVDQALEELLGFITAQIQASLEDGA